ncbi:MAG: bifunctional glutamate N-acetyltransferase/amino-acid acetyltransferase ArgJ [Pseudomonadota bacterium]
MNPKRLKRALRRSRRAVKAQAAAGETISPLAPAQFPSLPRIDGVRFGAIETGIKYRDRPDVMLAHLAPGTEVVGVFTRSKTRSAAVNDCIAKIAPAKGRAAAILVNAGNANAFTGVDGEGSVQALTKAVGTRMNIPEARVFTASTGVIGEKLPHEKIIEGLKTAYGRLSADGIKAAAGAIRTTDTFAKGAGCTVEIKGKTVSIAGFAKGSGMIAPDMATMLAYIFTDAKADFDFLRGALKTLTKETFNAITVDSDTSTSDTLMLAATGKSGVDVTASRIFVDALRNVLHDLALQIVRDGEGATKLIEVAVTGAASNEDARKVAMSIANSPLVKTAVAGEDANWGRVVMAVGKSGAEANRDTLSIRFGDIAVAEAGIVSPTYSEADASTYMKNDEILIGVDLAMGAGHYTAWTCDLTHGYISINADYRS